MTGKFLLALVLGLTTASARADVSDSGDLTIGGTGVIQGTMTVQGNAFSVGGATFSVSGGSITLGGRLNAAAAGIKWADGTTSTTASSGGGGGLLLQYVSSSTTGQYQGLGTAIPNDNTIPQISEGFQVLIATITPLNSASRLKIEVTLNAAEFSNVTGDGVVCIFKDSGGNALACAFILTAGGAPTATTTLRYIEMAGSLTQRNYSVRAGDSVAGNMTINLNPSGVSVYGGRLTSVLDISEIAP